jgi:phenylacetic acid degradation operon negative regulatory protein
MAPNPRNLILNLLLGAGSEPLSARSAVASCALFGIRENSVRVALVRLAASGLVEAAGRGAYRLGRMPRSSPRPCHLAGPRRA